MHKPSFYVSSSTFRLIMSVSMDVSNALSFNGGIQSLLNSQNIPNQKVPPSDVMQTVPSIHNSKIDLILDLLNQQSDKTVKFVLLYSDCKGPRIYTNEKCSLKVRDNSNFLETSYGSQLGPNWIQFNQSIPNRNQRTNSSIVGNTSQNSSSGFDSSRNGLSHQIQSTPITVPSVRPHVPKMIPGTFQCKTEVVTDFSDFWEIEPSSLQSSYQFYQRQNDSLCNSTEPPVTSVDNIAPDIVNSYHVNPNDSNLSISPENSILNSHNCLPEPTQGPNSPSKPFTTVNNGNLSQSFVHLINRISSEENPRSYKCQV